MNGEPPVPRIAAALVVTHGMRQPSAFAPPQPFVQEAQLRVVQVLDLIRSSGGTAAQP